MEKSNFLKYPSEYKLQKKNRNLKSAVLQMLNLNDSSVKGEEKKYCMATTTLCLKSKLFCFLFCFFFRSEHVCVITEPWKIQHGKQANDNV